MATAIASQPHTPGPWYLSTKCPLASDDINRIEFYIFSEKGNIATIPTDLISHANRDAEANARLIVQAPALLKSCKDLVDSVDMGDLFDHDVDCQDPDKCVLCVARKVIADAEG
jgi:hypothetical protein